MTEDQNTKTIKEFQKSVEEARKCIEEIPFDLVKIENKLDKMQFTVSDFSDNFIKTHHSVVPGNISNSNFLAIHYTSIGTLVSMLQHTTEDKDHVTNKNNHVNNRKNNILRAYDSVHFNDPNEGKFFDRNSSKDYKLLLGKEQHHAYVASFIRPSSKDKNGDMDDNLVFWRTYGKDGEGCSLSLMIDSSCLQKVVYGQDQMIKNMEDFVPMLCGLSKLKISIEKIHPAAQKLLETKIAEITWESLEKIRYLYKSEAYKYENECRFILTESDIDKDKKDKGDQEKGRQIRYEYWRNSNPACLRHYYEHEKLKMESMLTTGSRIVLGPCVSEVDDVRRSIKNLLERASLFGIDVIDSGIDYRKS